MAISPPIEPAAPVTKITLSLSSLCSMGLSIFIGFLFNRSSILTSLIWPICKLPSIHFSTGGTTFTFTGSDTRLSTISINLYGFTFCIETMISLIFLSLRKSSVIF